MTAQQFTKLINEHSPSLQRSALKFTKDMDDAHDLMQDTILKAISFYGMVEEGTNLKGWLYVVMRNTFINNYRKNSKAKCLISQQETISESNLLISASFNSAISSFAMADITRVLNRLPETVSVPFIRFTEGYRYEEIAIELAIPLGTVKTRIRQARELLKSRLRTHSTRIN